MNLRQLELFAAGLEHPGNTQPVALEYLPLEVLDHADAGDHLGRRCRETRQYRQPFTD